MFSVFPAGAWYRPVIGRLFSTRARACSSLSLRSIMRPSCCEPPAPCIRRARLFFQLPLVSCVPSYSVHLSALLYARNLALAVPLLPIWKRRNSRADSWLIVTCYLSYLETRGNLRAGTLISGSGPDISSRLLLLHAGYPAAPFFFYLVYIRRERLTRRLLLTYRFRALARGEFVELGAKRKSGFA